MSPAKTCSEIFTAPLHLIEVLAATTTASTRCAGLGTSLSPILRPVRGLDSRVRLSRGLLLRGPGFGKRFGARHLARPGPSEVTAPTSAPQDGVSSGAVAGTTMLCILSTRSSGDLARELKEGPGGRGWASPTPACKRRADQGGGVIFHVAFRGSVRAWRSHSGLAQRSAATPAAAAARTPTVVDVAASIGATGFGVGAFVYSLP